jgi:hypothetical protein
MLVFPSKDVYELAGAGDGKVIFFIGHFGYFYGFVGASVVDVAGLG